MHFSPTLRQGSLIRRYKRFLADIVLDDGECITAHCPNTGSMLGCRAPGSRVWVSRASNPARKLAWTWELVEVAGPTLVGIHTGRANGLVAEAIRAGEIEPLSGYDSLRAEVPHPLGGRADFLLTDPGRKPCWVEVKSVTLADRRGNGLFPDAVSARAVRHLETLAATVRGGERAVLLFCVQREDVDRVLPADRIDPAYARALAEAQAAGVEILAWRARVSPERLYLERQLAVSVHGMEPRTASGTRNGASRPVPPDPGMF